MNAKKSNNKIVIVGGGFGGIKAALELSRSGEFAVTLVNDQPDFRYNPTLYHTATGGLMRQSSISIASLLEGSSIEFVHGTAEKLDRKKQAIKLVGGKTLTYGTLVLALGVVTNYFHIPGLAEYSYGIKSPAEVTRFKQHLHTLIEDGGKPDLNYIIVGGGPTGIELAGALPAYLHKIMKDHHIKDRRVHIKLVEAAPRLLPRSNQKTSRAVAKRLEKLGIEIMLGKTVEGESSDELTVDHKAIKSHTVVWTAGTTNNPFFANNTFTLTDRGKVVVDDHLLAEKNIYVLGDNAGTPFSGLAQTAVYDGHYVAHDIEAKWYGNEGVPYRAKTPATVIPVGPGWAVFEYRQLVITGRLGWSIREAADWIGFHDLEPWWKASEQWATEFGEEETSTAHDSH
jgi:NADH dehydrogenase